MKQEGQKSKKIKKRAGSSRGRMPDGTPNPIDVFVGERLRLRRTMLGLSLEELAAQMGMTFQQLRKYEWGTNRISASRLWDLSVSLGVSIDFFFEDMDEKTASLSPRYLSPRFNSSEETENLEEDTEDPMSKKETLELVRAYYKINNRETARLLCELIEALSKTTAAKKQ